MPWPYLVPAALSAAFALVGAWREGRQRVIDPLTIVLIGGLGLAVLAALASDRGTGVPDDRLVQGVFVGTLFIGLLPAVAYYALGRSLRRRRGWLAVAWLIGLAPLYYYLLIAVLLTADLVDCAPDAYECPL